LIEMKLEFYEKPKQYGNTELQSHAMLCYVSFYIASHISLLARKVKFMSPFSYKVYRRFGTERNINKTDIKSIQFS
jgi:hypothetical protein